MKKVERYETEDGAIFDTSEAAQQHEQIMGLREWYEDNKLYGSFEGCRIEFDDLVEWLTENQEMVRTIIRRG